MFVVIAFIFVGLTSAYLVRKRSARKQAESPAR
jgi:hypothetical protein